MLDQQPVAPVPVSGPVQVESLPVQVPVSLGPGGLGFVDPALRHHELLGQEALPAERLVRLLQRAVPGQNLPDGPLPLAEDKTKL